jgi:hypothetical protein
MVALLFYNLHHLHPYTYIYAYFYIYIYIYICIYICIGAYSALDSKVKTTWIESIEEGKIDQDEIDFGSDYEKYVDNSRHKTSFWRQYSVLVHRDFMLALRDPALYYLQFLLCCLFGFLVGAAFLRYIYMYIYLFIYIYILIYIYIYVYTYLYIYRLKFKIGAGMMNVSASLVWIVLVVSYIQIFKVYHLNRGNMRLKHELSNNTYSVYPAFFSELTTTAIGLLVIMLLSSSYLTFS